MVYKTLTINFFTSIFYIFTAARVVRKEQKKWKKFCFEYFMQFSFYSFSLLVFHFFFVIGITQNGGFEYMLATQEKN